MGSPTVLPNLFNTIFTLIAPPTYLEQRRSTSIRASTKSQSSAFLRLPVELRLEIYKDVFNGSKIWVNPKQLRFWQTRRRSDDFISNGRWMVLMTCKQCYEEAHQLLVRMTAFIVGRPYLTYSESTHLIRFAENVSEFSKLNLVELREYLTGSLQLSIRAIPLFPNIRSCVLSVRLFQNVPDQCSQIRCIYHLPSGYMTKAEVRTIFHRVKEQEKNVGRFINSILTEQYRYMRHIDFLLCLHLYSQHWQYMGFTEDSQGFTSLIKARCYVNIGQKSGFYDRENDFDEEDGLNRVRRRRTGINRVVPK